MAELNNKQYYGVLQRDGFHCMYCNFDASAPEYRTFLTVDHFRPRSKGGGNSPSNLYAACRDCNLLKGSAEFSDLAEARVYLSKLKHIVKDILELKYREVSPQPEASSGIKIQHGGMLKLPIEDDPKLTQLLRGAVKRCRRYWGRPLAVREGLVLLLY